MEGVGILRPASLEGEGEWSLDVDMMGIRI